MGIEVGAERKDLYDRVKRDRRYFYKGFEWSTNSGVILDLEDSRYKFIIAWEEEGRVVACIREDYEFTEGYRYFVLTDKDGKAYIAEGHEVVDRYWKHNKIDEEKVKILERLLWI